MIKTMGPFLAASPRKDSPQRDSKVGIDLQSGDLLVSNLVLPEVTVERLSAHVDGLPEWLAKNISLSSLMSSQLPTSTALGTLLQGLQVQDLRMVIPQQTVDKLVRKFATPKLEQEGVSDLNLRFRRGQIDAVGRCHVMPLVNPQFSITANLSVSADNQIRFAIERAHAAGISVGGLVTDAIAVVMREHLGSVRQDRQTITASVDRLIPTGVNAVLKRIEILDGAIAVEAGAPTRK